MYALVYIVIWSKIWLVCLRVHLSPSFQARSTDRWYISDIEAL